MLNWVDLSIALAYVLGLFTFGMWTGIRETSDDFLILSRRASLPLVLFSIVSSWVGVGTTVATAASAYDKGISLGLTGAVGSLIGVTTAGLLARRIKVFGDTFRAHTLGDFFGVRYSVRARYASSTVIIIVYVLLCAAQYVGLTRLLEVWAGASMQWTIAAAAISTITYTAFAGIKSDFYTDGVHFFVLCAVIFFVLFPHVSSHAGGFSALSHLPSRYWNPFAYGGVGFFLAGIAFGVASVFVTMEIWQRIFASATVRTARLSMLLGGGVIFLFYSVSTVLGLFAKVLLPNLPIRDHALYALMSTTLPTGLLGLGVAAFLGIFVSTVNTMMMVVSATLTKDFYLSAWKPGASDGEVLRVGRITTFCAGALAYVAAVIVHDLVVLAVNSLFFLLVLLPSVMAGFFWKRATATAAFWSIALGFATLLLLLPAYPAEAFAPAFGVSALVLFFLSLTTNHEETETWPLIERGDL